LSFKSDAGTTIRRTFDQRSRHVRMSFGGQSMRPALRSTAVTCTKYAPGASVIRLFQRTTPDVAAGASLIVSRRTTFFASKAPLAPTSERSATVSCTGRTSPTAT
jgi:hypothetical protein